MYDMNEDRTGKWQQKVGPSTNVKFMKKPSAKHKTKRETRKAHVKPTKFRRGLRGSHSSPSPFGTSHGDKLTYLCSRKHIPAITPHRNSMVLNIVTTHLIGATKSRVKM